MKTIILLAAVFFSFSLSAQIDVKEKAKDKTSQKADEKVDEAIDNTLEGVENGVKKIFKKKDKSKNKQKESAQENNEEESNNDENTEENTDNEDNNNKQIGTNNMPASLSVYSKFDFIPGEKLIFFDDFSDVNIGDFPLRWNTNASGEVVTADGFAGKWFRLKDDYSYYTPECFTELPENYTVEFDALIVDGCDFDLEIFERAEQDISTDYYPGNGGINIHFLYYEFGWKNWDNNVENSIKSGDNKLKKEMEENTSKHFSIWIQKTRLRVYLNEEKVLDVPRAIYNNFKFNQFRFCGYSPIMISNVRIAVGLPDTRSRLITEGKLVTRGILFNSGSDKIKPESYGTLKDISTILTENSTIRVKIVGHTDSDGDETTNLDLSKRRALAVKNSLVKDFGIDASRLESDGKGENEPTDKNDTPQGKANNRRVEFIKL